MIVSSGQFILSSSCIHVAKRRRPSADTRKKHMPISPPHDLYTTADLSSLLRKYTDSHALSHPSHRSLLLIHPSASPTPDKLSPEQQAGIALLARCVCKKGEDPKEVGREKGSPGCVSREEALKRIRKEGCTGYWGMVKPGQVDEVVKYVSSRKGVPSFKRARRASTKTLPCRLMRIGDLALTPFFHP